MADASGIGAMSSLYGGEYADVFKKLQKSWKAANTANETRYQGILDQYSNLGQAGMTRIGQQEQQAMASGTQDLASRGLGNTTIRGSMARGVASDAELARQQLGESVATQKAGVMERRTDEGPDLAMFSNLLQNAANKPKAPERMVRIETGNYISGPQHIMVPASESYKYPGGRAR